MALTDMSVIPRLSVMPEKVFVRNVPDRLWRRLKAGAAGRGMTVSKAVAQALEAWLDRPDSEPSRFAWQGITDLGATGETSVSERHDEHLARSIHERKSR
jgi:plasmid stability protein